MFTQKGYLTKTFVRSTIVLYDHRYLLSTIIYLCIHLDNCNPVCDVSLFYIVRQFIYRPHSLAFGVDQKSREIRNPGRSGNPGPHLPRSQAVKRGKQSATQCPVCAGFQTGLCVVRPGLLKLNGISVSFVPPPRHHVIIVRHSVLQCRSVWVLSCQKGLGRLYRQVQATSGFIVSLFRRT